MRTGVLFPSSFLTLHCNAMAFSFYTVITKYASVLFIGLLFCTPVSFRLVSLFLYPITWHTFSTDKISRFFRFGCSTFSTVCDLYPSFPTACDLVFPVVPLFTMQALGDAPHLCNQLFVRRLLWHPWHFPFSPVLSRRYSQGQLTVLITVF